MLHARGSVLIPEFLPALFVAEDPTSDRPGPVDWAAYTQRLIKAGSTNVYSQALQAMERQLITAVLRTTNGNQVQAAKILGITRGNLRNKIKSLGITIDRWIWSQTDQDGGSPIREI
jgi:two-component system nitrogen regulation response regulator GlnG